MPEKDRMRSGAPSGTVGTVGGVAAESGEAGPSRRSMLRGAAGIGAAGLAAGAIGGLAAAPALAATGKSAAAAHLENSQHSDAPRADLEAILLTGLPPGILPGFQNYTGAVQADMLRLNTAIKPAKKPNILGIIGGDLAGFPNGRRVFDDVVTVELRAIAGLTYPLVDSKYTPDGAAGVVTDGLTNTSVKAGYLNKFPYLGVPYSGFYNPS